MKKYVFDVLGRSDIKLYTIDWQKEPITLLKDDRQKLTKANINDGDTLVWRE